MPGDDPFVQIAKNLEPVLAKERARIERVETRMREWQGEFAEGTRLAGLAAKEFREGKAAQIALAAKLSVIVKEVEEIKKNMPSMADIKAVLLKVDALTERVKKLEARK